MEDYKVADITLAEFGRKEIEIAEQEMQGRMEQEKNTVPKNLSKVLKLWAVCT